MLIGSGAGELLETKPWMARIGGGIDKLCFLREGIEERLTVTRASPHEHNLSTPRSILDIQGFVSSNSRAPDPMSMVSRGAVHRVTVFRELS